MSFWLAGLAACSLALAGCRETEPATGIIIEITTNLQVTEELDRVQVLAFGGPGPDDEAFRYTYELGTGPNRRLLPVRVGFYPVGEGTSPVRIQVTGFSKESWVISRSATLTFPPKGERVLLAMPLLSTCRLVSCGAMYTCKESGKCEIDTVDVNTLPPYTGPKPDSPIGRPDAMEAVDLPGAMDASLPRQDADVPDSLDAPGLDVAVSDMGPAPTSDADPPPPDGTTSTTFPDASVDAWPGAEPDALAATPDVAAAPEVSVSVDAALPDVPADAPNGCGGIMCHALAMCDRSGSTPRCRCSAGYLDETGDGSSCVDINECQMSNGGCHPDAICMNTSGGRRCECKSGYTGDGLTCTDVNECLVTNGGCHPDAACTNRPGDHTCACKPGYMGDGRTCMDINECLMSSGGCDPNATCTNTPGGHLCSCNDGYTGDGRNCLNVDPALATLTLSTGNLDPPFAPATTSYTVIVPNAADSIVVTPTAARPGGTITVNGTMVASGSASPANPLMVGSNAIAVVSTAASGHSRQYTLNVTRMAPADPNQTTPGTPTAVAGASSWIAVTSPFTGDANRNGYTTYEIATDPTGPFTPVSAEGGAQFPGPTEWRATYINMRMPATAYYVRVIYNDPDGVAGTNPILLGPITTAASAVNSAAVGTFSAVAAGEEILGSVNMLDDANQNSWVRFEIATSAAGPWTRRCGGPPLSSSDITSPFSPKRCRYRSLTPGTDYWVRVTVSDPEGTTGASSVQTLGPIRYTGARNLALGRPTTADAGFACCTNPAQLTDGRIQYDNWAFGFAWAGGTGNWGGGGPGWKQATIDLGAATTVSRMVVWYHDAKGIHTTWKVQRSDDGTSWTDVASTTSSQCRPGSLFFSGHWSFPACADQLSFAPVSTRYVRYTFDDRTLHEGIHGWAVEVEVF